MKKLSLWIDSSQKSKVSEKNPLNGRVETDVAVIGAGITGLTTALRLSQTGKRVVVLEALQIGCGTTGHSSCHLTTEIESNYSSVASEFGLETARTVAESRKEAINFIEKMSDIYNIDSDFKRVTGYTFTNEESSLEQLKEEAKVAADCGLQASFEKTFPLTFPVKGVLKFENEAKFNSQKYLLGLANVCANKGVKIYENTRVTNIDEQKGGFVLSTDEGEVYSKEVVQATHYPIAFNILQTMAAPYRSYMLCFKMKKEIQDALYYDTNSPYNYFRLYDHEEHGQILVAGGGDHKTGHVTDTEQCYKSVEEFTRKYFNVGELLYKWSSQYYNPVDGLPYIGKNPIGGNSYLATGFMGDGLVYGTVAGIILSDLISEKDNPWAKVYDSTRFTPIASAKEFVKENTGVAKHFIKGWFEGAEEELDRIEPGEGKILKFNGTQLGVSRDKYNELHVVSPVCTHLKCIVNWNKEEESWDCPCHGSRFDPDGKLIVGPALSNLEKIRLPSSHNYPGKK